MLDINLLKKHQSFSSIKEMDQAVRAFLYHHKPELSTGTITTLKHIWRHSLKFSIGVSFCKIQTIVKSTKLSRSTVIRAINTLQEYGLLKRVPTLKPNGKRGVNLLVIQAIEGYSLPSHDTANKTVDETLPKQQNPWESMSERREVDTETENKQSISNKDISNNARELDASFAPSYIPESFKDITGNFYSAKEILNLWKRVKIAYEKSNLNMPLNDCISGINQLFKESIFALKNNLIRTTFNQYFYGGLVKVFDQYKKREIMNDPDNLFYDWLQEA